MQHRHLIHQRLTLAAIDDVISRGRWDDWADLRRAALQDLTQYCSLKLNSMPNYRLQSTGAADGKNQEAFEHWS